MKLIYSNLFKHSKYQCKVSPNNLYVANGVENRLVIRKQELDLSVLQVFETRQPIDYIQWAPDSQYILAVNYEKHRIEIYSVMDPKWQGTIVDHGFHFNKVIWSPDSKNILCFSDLQLRLSIWNLLTRELKYIEHVKYSEKGFEISPDKKYAAILEKYEGKEYLGIYHSHSFIPIQRFELDTVDAENIKWSPNSMYISIWDNCLYYKLLIYRLDGVLCTTYSGYEFGLGIKCVNWSPNSDIIALGNYDDTVHLISSSSWKLIGVLEHTTTVNGAMDINILEEINTIEPRTSKKNIYYKHIFNRPFNIPTRRPNYNEANPKIGITSCCFGSNGTYLYTKSDTMPSVLFIWELKTLQRSHLILFKHYLKQTIWNPMNENTLISLCGNETIHYIELNNKTDSKIEVKPITIPTNDFNIKHVKWNNNGHSLLLMEKDLYCLAMRK